VAINASAQRGLARLKTLPLGLGRTEVLVSQWYRDHGMDDERYDWLKRAVDVNPANNNAHYLLGIYYDEFGDPRRAALSYERAVALRPDKLLFRVHLAGALYNSEQYERALDPLEHLIESEPWNANYWTLYAEALKKLGREEDARAVFEEAARLYHEMWERHPEAAGINFGYGQILYNLGRYEEALARFQQAVSTRPNDDVMLGFVGYTLRELGRDEEAGAYFRRCLDINPEHPDRAEMERVLEEGSRAR